MTFEEWQGKHGPNGGAYDIEMLRAGRDLERYYDFDLANFTRDVPRDFWHHASNRAKRPVKHKVRTLLKTEKGKEKARENGD